MLDLLYHETDSFHKHTHRSKHEHAKGWLDHYLPQGVPGI